MKALEEYVISRLMPQEPVSDPQLSPDGSLIAFTYTEVNYEEDRYDSSIWVKELGEEGKRLTYGNADSSPRWSPDGTQIAFLSNRAPVEGAKGKQLWLISVGGGEAGRFTEMPWGVRNPRWSPNGDAVYFHSEGAPRRPMEPAERVFTALIQQMRVTELIRFPGGGHSPVKEWRPPS